MPKPIPQSSNPCPGPNNTSSAGSDFVVRLRQSAAAEGIEARPLTAEDQPARVAEDAVVRLRDQRGQAPDAPLRRVTILAADRHGQPAEIVLLTHRLDLSAALIGLIYRHRWQVELFFRWLKCVAHFEHFFSESRAGMTRQVYVTMIGTLLIALQIGAKPSKYDYALMACAVLGWTSLAHVQAMARKRAESARRAAERKAARAAADRRSGRLHVPVPPSF
jgi:hypothetical protein